MRNCIIVMISFIFLASCSSHSKESVQTTTKMLDNGEYLETHKTNIETTTKGMFTGHNYGTYHSFEYKFVIKGNNIEWIGMRSQEPKNIVFCENKLYLRYLEKEHEYIETIDSLTQDTTHTSHYEVKEVFSQHIDQRYFFNEFGSQFWQNIPIEEYKKIKQTCKEYDIPNDEELILGQIIE